MVKAPLPFRSLWGSHQAPLLNQARVALGHTRHASQGAPGRLANAAPLEAGRLVGTVNGDIDANDLRQRLPPGLPPPKGETDSELLLLALDRVRDDLEAVCEVLATARSVTALAWVDRTRPSLVFLARGALCPLAVARDTHGHLYWGSSPTWFHCLDEQAGGRLGFQVERVAEGTVLAIATDKAVPTVIAERSFTPTARPAMRSGSRRFGPVSIRARWRCSGPRPVTTSPCLPTSPTSPTRLTGLTPL